MNVEAASQFIADKLAKELPANLAYHNLNHAKDVAEAAVRLAKEEHVAERDIELLRVAGLFHDSGYIVRPEGHELTSCEIARQELPEFDFTPGEIETICGLIMATRLPRDPKNFLEEIICDADLDYLGRDDYSVHAHGLFLELKSLGNGYNEKEWHDRQIAFLKEHKYYTQAARRDRDTKKQEILMKLIAPANTNNHGKEHPLIGHIQDYALMLLGVFISGFGLKGFLVPNNFFDGGVTGLSLLIHDLYKFNLAYVIILANLPFVIAGIYVLDAKFALKTFICISALACCLYFIHYPVITSDKLLISIFGGVFVGTGIGFTMRGGFALDGIEILALYTLKRSSLSISEIILGINALIFSVAAIKFGIETALYSMLTYYTATRTIDYVIEGWEAFTGVTIISGKSEEIKKKLVLEMGRGITVYKGQRGFLPGSFEVSNDCDIIFTVITRLEVRRLKNMVNSIDPKAFVFISTIKEAAGGIIKKKNMH